MFTLKVRSSQVSTLGKLTVSVFLRTRPELTKLSVLDLCPLQRISALGRSHCSNDSISKNHLHLRQQHNSMFCLTLLSKYTQGLALRELPYLRIILLARCHLIYL